MKETIPDYRKRIYIKTAAEEYEWRARPGFTPTCFYAVHKPLDGEIGCTKDFRIIRLDDPGESSFLMIFREVYRAAMLAILKEVDIKLIDSDYNCNYKFDPVEKYPLGRYPLCAYELGTLSDGTRLISFPGLDRFKERLQEKMMTE